MKLLDPRKSYLMAIFLVILSSAAYGLVYYVKSAVLFTLLSISGRLMHGLEDTLFEVISVHFLQKLPGSTPAQKNAQDSNGKPDAINFEN